MTDTLEIEAGIEATVGHCDACGHASKMFRGVVYAHGNAHALYLCHYTESHPEQGVSMAVSLRGWGEDVDPTLKECVTLEWRHADTGPGCRVVDALDTQWAREPVLGRMLSRDEALASGRAAEAYAVSDAVWLGDLRLQHSLKGG